VPGGAYQAPVEATSLDDPHVRDRLDDYTFAEVKGQLEMLDGAGAAFDLAAVHAGRQTPVYFGSAVNNFGVQLMLDGFLRNSLPPQPRRNAAIAKAARARTQAGSASGVAETVAESVPDQTTAIAAPLVPVTHGKFSGFIFKIQANMDPNHRDRIAFLRVCSGRFNRDMSVILQRTGRTIRLSSSHKLFGQERETVDVAYPGDVIGLVGHDSFGIGDTLTEDRSILFEEIPRFPPEVFAFISNPTPADAKKFRAGLEQLLQEGVVQSFNLRAGMTSATLLAAVGPLQFEVVQYRLKSEYNAGSRLETTPWTLLRWLAVKTCPADTAAAQKIEVTRLLVASGVAFGTDKKDAPVVLFPNDWTLRYFLEKNPELALLELPREQGGASP
jgi:peptide chain release factor 3